MTTSLYFKINQSLTLWFAKQNSKIHQNYCCGNTNAKKWNQWHTTCRRGDALVTNGNTRFNLYNFISVAPKGGQLLIYYCYSCSEPSRPIHCRYGCCGLRPKPPSTKGVACWCAPWLGSIPGLSRERLSKKRRSQRLWPLGHGATPLKETSNSDLRGANTIVGIELKIGSINCPGGVT